MLGLLLKLIEKISFLFQVEGHGLKTSLVGMSELFRRTDYIEAF